MKLFRILSTKLSSSKSQQLPNFYEADFLLHAVNSPLSGLAINLEMCLDEISHQSDNSVLRQQLVQSLMQAKHLQALFKALTSPHVKSSFSLRRALTEIYQRFHQPNSNQVVIVNLDISDSVVLKGLSFYFQEAFSCLLTNAFEAMPKTLRPRKVVLTAFTVQEKCYIHLSDPGKGMNWLTKSLAFRKGFSTKRKNTGLGLHAARSIIQNYFHGQLEMSSFPGLGTTCLIVLPITQKPYTQNHGQF